MVRTILAVIIGFVAWWVVGACALFLLRVGWPEYALVEPAMTFTLPMQIARLIVGVVCSVAGGWLAAVIAKGDLRAAWWLGVVLVLVFIPIHYGLWDKFPIWYHLAFLLTLAPINGYSGRLATRPSSVLASHVMRWLWLVSLVVAFTGPSAAQSPTFDIYWIDVEGGAATLLVSPSGQSLLYDAGWEVGDRDAKRIFAVAQQAGLKKIDYFVLSHFHGDHAGGLPALAKLIPIDRCFDRGDFIEPVNQRWRDAYLSVCAGKRTIVNVGDRIPLKDVRVDVIASNGRLLAKPMNGGGPNPLCATAENRPAEGPENQYMVGALVERIARSPGVEGIWQGHRSLLDPDHNTAENMIANLEDTPECQGHWIKASIDRRGTFIVTNSRNGLSRTYQAR